MRFLQGKKLTLCLLVWALTVLNTQHVFAQEVEVISGVDEAIAWMESENWWGEEKRGQQLQVPHALITGFSDRWRDSAMKMPVSQKKEIFYRLMLPLIMHANSMVLTRREELREVQTKLETGEALSPGEIWKSGSA